MMTTISAFMVKTTPIAALKVRNMLDQHAAGRDQRAAEREREGRRLAHVDRDQLRRDRIDRDGAHRGAGARAGQRKIERRRR